MKKDFIPVVLGDLDTWEVNFKNKLPDIAAQLGINATEVTAAITLLDAHRNSYAEANKKRNESKAATSANADAQKKAVKAIREISTRIKSAKDYTQAIGNELKIIGSETLLDLASAKPTLTISKEGSGIIIKFPKGQTDGVHIFCKRGTQTEFSFLAVDTVSPYHDNRPNLVAGQSEKREYKAWYFLDEGIIGQESDVVSINV
jgi:hypothetical protein